MPEVSVVISLYNHERYLAQCVASVLEQTFSDLEAIIVDDASTDGGLELARALERQAPGRVKVYSNARNLGVSRTRNFGVYKSTGPILAFLDADDYWLPEKLERQVRAFREDPGLGLCHCCAAVECDEASRLWLGENRGMSAAVFAAWAGSFAAFCREAEGFGRIDYFRWLLTANNICLSTVAVRRDAFKRAGGFLDGLRCQCEDWLLWLKLSMLAEFRSIPDELAVYRFHHASHTAQVFMRPDFDFQSVRTEVVGAARSFDPPRFDALLEAVRALGNPPTNT
ncbi:glycosyltransferase family 2 protein [Fundidesulfovibrio terrae]|uniref:glycosyltransferase family 2 protein n=1 Tax=Fundidesulfovibrio terrae TaxID=2922866 RepID=UPI001FAF1342|nr:glycosyltransferase family 2 protein [Fundidesulfovibrio terrae]